MKFGNRNKPEKVRSISSERQASTDFSLRQFYGGRESVGGGSVAGGGDVWEKSGKLWPWMVGPSERRLWRLGVNVLLLLVVVWGFKFEFWCERRRRRRTSEWRKESAVVEMRGERGREETEIVAEDEDEPWGDGAAHFCRRREDEIDQTLHLNRTIFS